jgi:hypothetical protein
MCGTPGSYSAFWVQKAWRLAIQINFFHDFHQYLQENDKSNSNYGYDYFILHSFKFTHHPTIEHQSELLKASLNKTQIIKTLTDSGMSQKCTKCSVNR